MSNNTNSLARVPCTIVTGFLGAGKFWPMHAAAGSQ